MAVDMKAADVDVADSELVDSFASVDADFDVAAVQN